MQIIKLPKQAIFMLHKLSRSVTEMTGYRCKLSRSKELIHLLKLASLVKNQRVRVQFTQFLTQLDREQLKALLCSGIKLPTTLIKKVKQPFWVRTFQTVCDRVNTTINNFQNQFIGSPSLVS